MHSETTCWTLIQGAATGRKEDREQFAFRYAPVIRAYLDVRWRGSPVRAELDDAEQEVFVECFRAGGVLERVDRTRPGGFRAFLYGTTRNVASRFERRVGQRRARLSAAGMDVDDLARKDEATLSRAFDQAWAKTLLREAGRLQEERALAEERGRRSGLGALRRVALLRLRFEQDLPIRDIARRWDIDAVVLHREYERARREFKAALREVVLEHQGGSRVDIERECVNLLELLR